MLASVCVQCCRRQTWLILSKATAARSSQSFPTRNYLPILTCVPRRHVSSRSLYVIDWLSECSLTKVFESYYVFLSDNLCLPWWAVIPIVATSIRLVSFPTQFGAEHLRSQKVAIFNSPSILEQKAEVEQVARRSIKAAKPLQKKLRKEVNKRIRDQRLTAGRMITLQFSAVPLWMCASVAINNLCGRYHLFGLPVEMVRSDMASDGALWFSNLLLPDPYCVFPAVIFASLALNAIHWHSLTNPPGPNDSLMIRFFSHYVKFQSAAFTLFLTYVAISAPSAMTYFWAISTTMTMLLNVLSIDPRVKRLFRIQSAPWDAKFGDAIRGHLSWLYKRQQ